MKDYAPGILHISLLILSPSQDFNYNSYAWSGGSCSVRRWAVTYLEFLKPFFLFNLSTKQVDLDPTCKFEHWILVNSLLYPLK